MQTYGTEIEFSSNSNATHLIYTWLKHCSVYQNM